MFTRIPLSTGAPLLGVPNLAHLEADGRYICMLHTANGVSNVQLVQVPGRLPELTRSPRESIYMTERSSAQFDMQRMQAEPQGMLGG